MAFVISRSKCLSPRLLSLSFHHIGSSTIQRAQIAFPPPTDTEVLFRGNINSSTLCPTNSSHSGFPELLVCVNLANRCSALVSPLYFVVCNRSSREKATAIIGSHLFPFSQGSKSCTTCPISEKICLLCIIEFFI